LNSRPLRLNVQPQSVNACARHAYFPNDTRHFPIREWLRLAADFNAQRILSRVFHEQKARILWGY
jgi:hypothetical protein